MTQHIISSFLSRILAYCH